MQKNEVESFTGRYVKRLKLFANSSSRYIVSIVSSDIFLKLALLWFFIQAVYFAITVKYGLPPDETYHYTYIQLFAQHSPSPFLPDQNGYNVIIEAVRNPFFLYHYLFSFPYLLFKHLPDSYIYLRLINVVLGGGSLWLVYKIASLIRVSALVRNLSIFMLSSTLMFVFLSASINYDNLSILLSLASVYLLLKLWQKITARDVLLLASALAAGVMVKVNFLPLGFIVFALFISKYWRQLPTVLVLSKQTFRRGYKLNLALMVLLFLLSILIVQRYVVNVVSYGTYAPACQKVRPIADCRKSALFVRNEQVYSANHRPANKTPLKYSLDWGKLMQQRTYGVFAHKRFLPNRYITAWIAIIFILSVVALISKRVWRDRFMVILLIISLFYLLVLILDNYGNYRRSGILSLAVQGRYAFAVLPLFYLIGTHYNLRLLKNALVKAVYIVLTVLVFAVSSLPTYLHKTTTDWYTKSVLNSSVALRQYK